MNEELGLSALDNDIPFIGVLPQAIISSRKSVKPKRLMESMHRYRIWQSRDDTDDRENILDLFTIVLVDISSDPLLLFDGFL